MGVIGINTTTSLASMSGVDFHFANKVKMTLQNLKALLYGVGVLLGGG